MEEQQPVSRTDFTLPGQTDVYHGKVRDVYMIGDDTLVSVATDRISAFDVILPRAIPYKGQVLNQLAAYFLDATKDVLPNWLTSTPDPNVSIGHRLTPYKIEMVVRGGLVGYSWRVYQAGGRQICGATMPDGLQQYDMFSAPIITPSTKADEGHDEDIAPDEIVVRGLATAEEFAQLSKYVLALFARGQELAASRGLVLIDTKYEFGKDADGNVFVIDEIHTPDSSRYFYKESYEAYIADRTLPEPKHLSKEFVREWLMANGFSGQDGQQVPEMTDEVVASITERYIELYEVMSGQTFQRPSDDQPALKRIEANIRNALEEL